jgi:hypothetical protein
MVSASLRDVRQAGPQKRATSLPRLATRSYARRSLTTLCLSHARIARFAPLGDAGQNLRVPVIS